MEIMDMSNIEQIIEDNLFYIEQIIEDGTLLEGARRFDVGAFMGCRGGRLT